MIDTPATASVSAFIARWKASGASERGSQYASHDYRRLLEERKISCTMSRKGNCWDNSPMESFFATLKQERVYRRKYQNRQEARQDIFQYIEVWYNRKRRHSSIGYLSPEEFEKQQENVHRQQNRAAKLILHQIGGNPYPTFVRTTP